MEEELLDYSSDILTPLDIWVEDRPLLSVGQIPETPSLPEAQVDTIESVMDDMEVSLQGLGLS